MTEVLRVARDGVVIATPQGEVARRCDADFERQLLDRDTPVPAWIPESRAQPYPTVESVLAAIRRADPDAAVSVTYSEPAAVCRFVRTAAARSAVLYAAANLLLGLMLRLIRQPGATNGYRVIVFARLTGART